MAENLMTGQVWWCQLLHLRFGSAPNLNVYLHTLAFDGTNPLRVPQYG